MNASLKFSCYVYTISMYISVFLIQKISNSICDKNYCLVLNGGVRIKSSNRLCESLLNDNNGIVTIVMYKCVETILTPWHMLDSSRQIEQTDCIHPSLMHNICSPTECIIVVVYVQ